jgi:hypothetical protein
LQAKDLSRPVRRSPEAAFALRATARAKAAVGLRRTGWDCFSLASDDLRDLEAKSRRANPIKSRVSVSNYRSPTERRGLSLRLTGEQ